MGQGNGGGGFGAGFGSRQFRDLRQNLEPGQNFMEALMAQRRDKRKGIGAPIDGNNSGVRQFGEQQQAQAPLTGLGRRPGGEGIGK